MSEPYLILHKVRGEPAFDIAIKLESTAEWGEDVWIIPTSGHRAYPIASWELDRIVYDGDIEYAGGWTTILDQSKRYEWKDAPDHYACNDRPLREDKYTVAKRAVGLLEGLGLVKKVTVERRD